MASGRRFAILMCLAGLGLLLAGAGAGALVTAWFHPLKNYAEPEKLLWIAPGTPTPAIARQLQAEGIISHRYLFLAYVKTLKWSEPLQAGEYLFREPLTIPQVAERLNQGLIHYRELTIPEGSSLFEIPELFRGGGLTPSEDFGQVLEEVELISDLAPNASNLEGFLFPDTYRWNRQTTAEDLIHQMVQRFRQVASTHIVPRMDPGRLTLQQVVTLASLIEMETSVASERPLISSVFHNRLRPGHSASVRSNRDLCRQAERPLSRQDLPVRPGFQFTLQHLHHCRIATRTHSQSGAEVAPGGDPAGKDQLSLLRQRQPGGACLLRDLGETPAGRGGLPASS